VKDLNPMLKSTLMTTANGKPQTSSSHLPFAVNAMLKVTALLTSLVRKFGQQQLVMVNYARGFNQLETGKYFE